jgi:hypothetical protein
MKIAGGVIEAYGGDHVFGGTIMSSDGNYLVLIGKALTTTGRGKRYPLNNGTNMTYDGQNHQYIWDGSNWINVLTSGVSDDWYIMQLSVPTSGPGYIAHGLKIDVPVTSGMGVYSNATGTSGKGGVFHGVDSGISASSTDGVGGNFTSTNGEALVCYVNATASGTPLRISPAVSSSAPSHSAYKGSLWVTSQGKLYINTDDGSTWQLVGSQT